MFSAYAVADFRNKWETEKMNFLRNPAGLLELELNVEVGHFLMKKLHFRLNQGGAL